MSQPSKPHTPSIAPILAVNFVGTLGFSIVLPFLIFLVTRLGGNSVVYGVVGATYSAFQLVGAPILGRWSDSIGRKKVLLISQLGTFAAWCIFLVALSLPVTPLVEVDNRFLGAFTLTLPLAVLFAARALDGLTGGNISVANAYLADVTTEEDRSKNFGRMAVASNMGFIIGPAIAGVLGASEAGEWLPVLAALFISGVATAIILFALEDPKPCVLQENPEPASVRDVLGGDQKDCYKVKGEDKLSTRQILGLPFVGPMLGLQFLILLAFNFYYVAFPVYAASGLGWSLTQVGAYFTFLSVSMAIVQGPVLGRLANRVDGKTLVVVGGLILAASFAMFTSQDTVVVFGGALLLAVGNGLMWPSLLAALSKAAGREYQGAVQGLSGSFGAMASITGLLLGGGIYQLYGAQVFLISAFITAAASIFAMFIPTREAPTTTAVATEAT